MPGSVGSNGKIDPMVELLIEQGLERYGAGDLEAALDSWERVLTLVPDEPRAQGYVEYVRANYTLLTGGAAATSELAVPFGLATLDDEAAYDVEIAGRAATADPNAIPDAIPDATPGPWAPVPTNPGAPTLELSAPVDDGWFLDEAGALPAVSRPLPLPALPGDELDPYALPSSIELEADEPELPERYEVPGSSFADEKTRDIGSRRAVTADFVGPAAAEFDTADLTGEQTIEVRSRPRGFVRPSAPTADSTPAPAAFTVANEGVAEMSRSLPGMAWASADDSTVELRVRLRDAAAATEPEPDDAGEQPAASLDGGGDDDNLTIERGGWAQSVTSERTRERAPAPSSSLSFDIDDEGDPGGIDAPLVIVEDPVLADAATFTMRRRAPEPGSAGSEDNDNDSDEFDALATVDRGRAILELARSPVGRGDAVPVQVVARDLLAELDRGAPVGEPRDDRTRRHIVALLERAATTSQQGHHSSAVIAVDLALAEDPDSAVAQKLIHRSREAILDVYQQFLGNLAARPMLALPMHDLAREELDSRSAFLLSRVDGNLTFEEILDVAGMTRLEAFRYLARLLLRGILEVR